MISELQQIFKFNMSTRPHKSRTNSISISVDANQLQKWVDCRGRKSPTPQTRCTFEELKSFLQKTQKMKPEDVKAIAELTELYIRERLEATKNWINCVVSKKLQNKHRACLKLRLPFNGLENFRFRTKTCPNPDKKRSAGQFRFRTKKCSGGQKNKFRFRTKKFRQTKMVAG